MSSQGLRLQDPEVRGHPPTGDTRLPTGLETLGRGHRGRGGQGVLFVKSSGTIEASSFKVRVPFSRVVV